MGIRFGSLGLHILAAVCLIATMHPYQPLGFQAEKNAVFQALWKPLTAGNCFVAASRIAAAAPHVVQGSTSRVRRSLCASSSAIE
jgi:hypothetical protein